MQRTTRPIVNHPNRTTQAQTNKAILNQTAGAVSQSNTAAVACRKCKSQQVVANKRGYSFANLFKTLWWMGLFPLILVLIGTIGAYSFHMNVAVGIGGSSTGGGGGVVEGLIAIIGVIFGISIFISLPVSILIGFVGRSEIVNGCMNCGFKWRPAKRK